MKFNTIFLSSLLMLCTSIRANPIIDPGDCHLEEKLVARKYLSCKLNNGKFYDKVKSNCEVNYVCFVPYDEEVISNVSSQCIRLDGNVYCASSITTIESCKLGDAKFDLKSCLVTSESLFNNFSYDEITSSPTTTTTTTGKIYTIVTGRLTKVSTLKKSTTTTTTTTTKVFKTPDFTKTIPLTRTVATTHTLPITRTIVKTTRLTLTLRPTIEPHPTGLPLPIDVPRPVVPPLREITQKDMEE